MTRPPPDANFRDVFPGPAPENADAPRRFWRTTGCATVIAALIGAGATLLAQQVAGPSSTATTAPSTVTVTVSPSAPSPGGAAAPPGPSATGEPDVLWHDHFNMGNYVDFDSIPPQNGTGGLSRGNNTGEYNVNDDGTLWESATPPSKQQCIDRIATHGQETIAVDAGTRICYRTSGDRIVYIEILGVDPSASRPDRFETEVTIWRK